jgi:magnesium-transporting ATPase (P-type)
MATVLSGAALMDGALLVIAVLFALLGNLRAGLIMAATIPLSMLFAVALAVGLTPELLPMILSINLSRGATSMSKEGVIVKRLSSIQNFGGMDVLCADKTGTLTENRMSVERLGVGGDSFPWQAPWPGPAPRAFPRAPGVRHPFLQEGTPSDPMEQALLAKGVSDLRGTEHLHGDVEITGLHIVKCISQHVRNMCGSCCQVSRFIARGMALMPAALLSCSMPSFTLVRPV